MVPRTAKDIPDPSCARAQRRRISLEAHGKTGGHTTEHQNGEPVHDVRVSPIDEGADDAEEDDPCRTARQPADWSQLISSAVKPNNTKSASW